MVMERQFEGASDVGRFNPMLVTRNLYILIDLPVAMDTEEDNVV